MLDVLIYNALLITMENDNPGASIILDGAIGISGNRIAVVGDTSTVCKEYHAHREIDAAGSVVMPGFIDAHMHSGLGLFRGLAQDTKQWLHSCIWPLREAMTAEESARGSMIVLAEALKNGTTTMCDFDTYMNILVKNHVQIGSRGFVCQTIAALPPDVSNLPEGELYPLDSVQENKALYETQQLIEKWHNGADGRIKCMLGPQAPDRVSKEMLLTIKELSSRYNIPIHMHVACGKRETMQMCMRYNARTIPFLDEIGMLNSSLLGVHLSEATELEMKQYATSGAGMVLCSGSEAIIDGSIPPAFEFNYYSSRLALGSDQTPGGNSCNIFNEMKFTAILNKCRFQDPTVFPCWQVLKIATIDGAKAIGMGEQLGSLRVGKLADLQIIKLDSMNLNPVITDPVRNIIPNLVYAANGSEVDTVIVNGEFVVEDHKLTKVNEDVIKKEACEAAVNVLRRAKSNYLSQNSNVVEMYNSNLI